MMTLKGTGIFGLLLLMLAFAWPAHSKTPDGKTPAEESICDPLRSATPGLYGLCVAYCEAHDADLISPSGDPNALNKPNQRILANYNRRKKESDPAMPCVVVEPEPAPEAPVEMCPCWTSAELRELLPPEANFDFRLENACGKTVTSTGAISSVTLENYQFGLDGPGYRISVVNFEGCSVLKERFYEGGPPNGTPWATREEEAACRTMLMNHARENSISGVVWDCFDQ